MIAQVGWLLDNFFTRTFLNPPFSQEGEPEREFIDVSMDALEPGGVLATVVKAGIFADDDNKEWRDRFTRNHTVEAVISLPEDLFYPTAAPTSILIAKAHVPQRRDDRIMLGRVWNDGFEKLKGKRVETVGSQLPRLSRLFAASNAKRIHVENCEGYRSGCDTFQETVDPQQYLDNLISPEEAHEQHRRSVVMELYKATVTMPELAAETIRDFSATWDSLNPLPLERTEPVEFFFDVLTGKSQGEKHYNTGAYPYISSGDATNSIIRLIDSDNDEVFRDGGIHRNCFRAGMFCNHGRLLQEETEVAP